MKKSFQPTTLSILLDYLETLVLGRALLVLIENEAAFELSYAGQSPIIHNRIPPTRLPFKDLYFDTSAISFPPGYPQNLKQDALAEIARVARKRILVLGEFIPANEKERFQSNAAFRLVEKIVMQTPRRKSADTILSVFDF